MSSDEAPIPIKQGTSITMTGLITGPATEEAPEGTDFVLTGYTLKAQLRATPSALLAGEFTFVLSDQGTDPGAFSMSMTAAQTAAIPVSPATLTTGARKATNFLCDVTMTSPGGEVSPVADLVFAVTPGTNHA